MPGLSFVTLLAYDYRYAFDAITSYYSIADEIILGLDRDRLTWTRQPFHIDLSEVNQFIAHIDTARKIRIVEDNFHVSDKPIENDTAERNVLSQHCAAGNWIVQIDADEILLNPIDFRHWLATVPPDHGVLTRWHIVFKVFGEKVLLIDPPRELTPMATQRRNSYTYCRRVEEPMVISPLQLLHLSWGRTPDELRTKLHNWSHADDFDVEGYLKFWDSITLDNYQQARDFHPTHPGSWERLIPYTIQGLSQTYAWSRNPMP